MPAEDMPEAEDLKTLMALMIDDYFVVVDYFDEKESKPKAIGAANDSLNMQRAFQTLSHPRTQIRLRNMSICKTGLAKPP